MKYAWIVAAIASVVGASACHAQEGVDKAKATAFDARMFGGPLGQKTYACFVRRYDASHLAQHPKQKVSAMKLLVTAEIPQEEEIKEKVRGRLRDLLGGGKKEEKPAEPPPPPPPPPR